MQDSYVTPAAQLSTDELRGVSRTVAFRLRQLGEKSGLTEFEIECTLEFLRRQDQGPEYGQWLADDPVPLTSVSRRHLRLVTTD